MGIFFTFLVVYILKMLVFERNKAMYLNGNKVLWRQLCEFIDKKLKSKLKFVFCHLVCVINS